MEEGLFSVDDAVARLVSGQHRHERERTAEIDAAWQKRVEANPRLFNGRTVLGTHWDVVDGQLSIEAHEIGYATLVHWLETYGRAGHGAFRSRPPGRDVHFFASAVVVGSDGHILMGEMARHTFNPGAIYPPAGSFDLDDFRDVGQTSGVCADFAGNMHREVMEEVGLDLSQARAERGYRVYFGGNYLAIFKVFRFDSPTRELVRQANDWLKSGGDDELSAVVAVAPGTFDARMPRHVTALMRGLGANDRAQARL